MSDRATVTGLDDDEDVVYLFAMSHDLTQEQAQKTVDQLDGQFLDAGFVLMTHTELDTDADLVVQELDPDELEVIKGWDE